MRLFRIVRHRCSAVAANLSHFNDCALFMWVERVVRRATGRDRNDAAGGLRYPCGITLSTPSETVMLRRC